MLFTRKRQKPGQRRQLLNVGEVFVLWDVLLSEYHVLEHLNNFINLVHDIDLKALLDGQHKEYERQKQQLEKLLQRYQIQGPDQNRAPLRATSNLEVFTDEYIARELFVYAQEHIENLLRGVRDAVENDELRTTFIRLTRKQVDLVCSYTQYLNLKGWIETPPLYPSVPAATAEQLSVAAAFRLWDHLARRYDNLWENKLAHAIAHDVDFKALLIRGLAKLNEQIAVLEAECRRFGIPLPKKPSEVVVTPENTEIYKDDRLFRGLLDGLQGALSMHAEAVKQAVINDRVRRIFRDVLVQELDNYDMLVKYGKVKGWLHTAPSYLPLNTSK